MNFWLHDLALEAGQVVSVELLESAQSTLPAKTFEEISSGRNKKPLLDDSIRLSRAQALEKLIALPVVHERLACTVSTQTSHVAVVTEPDDFGYSFFALWHSHRPGECRVRLGTSSIEGLRRGEYSTARFEGILRHGEMVTLEIGA